MHLFITSFICFLQLSDIPGVHLPFFSSIWKLNLIIRQQCNLRDGEIMTNTVF